MAKTFKDEILEIIAYCDFNNKNNTLYSYILTSDTGKVNSIFYALALDDVDDFDEYSVSKKDVRMAIENLKNICENYSVDNTKLLLEIHKIRALLSTIKEAVPGQRINLISEITKIWYVRIAILEFIYEFHSI